MEADAREDVEGRGRGRGGEEWRGSREAFEADLRKLRVVLNEKEKDVAYQWLEHLLGEGG